MADDGDPIGPININRRHMLMGGALCATSALAFARLPQPDVAPLRPHALEAMIPNRIGPWRFHTASGLVVPPADALSDQLYDEVLTRVYVGENLPSVMFLIAYSSRQTGLLQVHRPEVCYPVGGFRLSATRILPLQIKQGTTLPVRMFTAQSSMRTEQVLYWTRLGDQLPTSWFQQRLAVMDANLHGVIPDGILVRASIVAPEAKEAFLQVERFCAALAQSLDSRARQLLFGMK